MGITGEKKIRTETILKKRIQKFTSMIKYMTPHIEDQ